MSKYEFKLNEKNIKNYITIIFSECQEYSDAIYKPINARCLHSAVQLIKGGERAAKGEFPHSALIGYEKSELDSHHIYIDHLIRANLIKTEINFVQ